MFSLAATFCRPHLVNTTKIFQSNGGYINGVSLYMYISPVYIMSSANVFSSEYQSVGYVNHNTASLPFPLYIYFEKCLENGNKKVEKPATFETRSIYISPRLATPRPSPLQSKYL